MARRSSTTSRAARWTSARWASLRCSRSRRLRNRAGRRLLERALGVHADAPLPAYESHSSISTYRSCPLRYGFRYVERRPGEVSPGQFAFGNAVHKAFEAFGLALKADGAIVGWGLNNAGQTNPPPGGPNTGFVAVAGGLYHSLGLRSDGSIVAYSWDFGDGATASGVTASHAYANAGTYTARLTVTDNSGASAGDTATVTVTTSTTNQLPIANAGPDKTATVGTSVAISGSGSQDPDGTISSYAWTFGDGATDSGVTTSHAYTTAGTYTFAVRATNSQGSALSPASGTHSIVITNTPAITSAAEARKSLAMTGAPLSGLPPLTIALGPSISISAPSRASSDAIQSRTAACPGVPGMRGPASTWCRTRASARSPSSAASTRTRGIPWRWRGWARSRCCSRCCHAVPSFSTSDAVRLM